jgi:hypothetical protein
MRNPATGPAFLRVERCDDLATAEARLLPDLLAEDPRRGVQALESATIGRVRPLPGVPATTGRMGSTSRPAPD